MASLEQSCLIWMKRGSHILHIKDLTSHEAAKDFLPKYFTQKVHLAFNLVGFEAQLK